MPDKKSVKRKMEEAVAAWEEKCREQVDKDALRASSPRGPVDGPLLNFKGGCDRGGLLTALRLARTSNQLTISELRTLLCERGIGMSDHAAKQIAEQAYFAFGESFSIEQIMTMLIPVKRTNSWEELNDSEQSIMQAAFAKVLASKGGGKAEAVNKAFLLKAAAEVPGLHPTGTPSDQELASLEEQCTSLYDGAVDLPDLFNLMRSPTTTTTTDSTYGPLVKAFAAFDMDASSSLTLPRCKQIITLFDGAAGAELESALAEAKVSAAEAKTDGEAFDKRKPKINYHTLVEAFLAGAAM